MPYLKETIAGLTRQTYRNFELLVQDGLSTDDSVGYLHSLEVAFPVHVVSEQDGSLVAGYNRAIRRCSGDLVVAAACDEVLDDDALEQYVSWHQERPDAVFIYGGSRIRDASGAVVEFQPTSFRLIDYVRHQMCPTTAGAFNRRLLGAELRLDESLRTVPDFELLTRLALRFGEDRIVCKEAITMTARGDEVSTSFRPEAFGQFARDKRIVIERLLSGGLRDAFLDYLRRDILFNMHAQFAEQVYALAGDSLVFREQVLAAQAEMPRLPRLKWLVAISRRFRWDEASETAILRGNVAPFPPPPGQTQVACRVDLAALTSEPHWMEAGASARMEGHGVRVRTPAGAWHYSAWAPIGGDFVRSEGSWYWLRVVVSDIARKPALALFEPVRNAIHQELPLARERRDREVYFEFNDCACTHLLLRNGDSAKSSSVLIREIEVLTMPIPPEPTA